MEFEDVLHIYSSGMLSSPGHEKWNEMTTVSELAHYHKYTVVPVGSQR